ncbi:MAG: ankyrin repeat domain-containing protein [Trueperaceae bacterium]|nr:ankyrin repeat domain-containing protein [Trueperaceae bacterium]
MIVKGWVLGCLMTALGLAQIPPSQSELKAYQGLFAAVVQGDTAQIETFAKTAELEQRDSSGRTALLLAAHLGQHDVAKTLLAAGADANAMDNQSYDILTIAAVNNDIAMIDLALAGGANPGNITSPYDGTALIAAAHLGNIETIERLIQAKAPLDHVNNLGWTALIEAIVLGDGGQRHTAVVKALLDAGANPHLADSRGISPLELAKARAFDEMVFLLEEATRP